MTPKRSSASDPIAPDVAELLEQRSRVMGWLERLNEMRGEASERVVERVRADYRARLGEVVERLSASREAIQEELQAARERRGEADEAHQAAVDALDEARLRSRIGEIPDAAWAGRRAELEGEVERTAAAVSDATAEVEHLHEVLAQIESGADTDFAAPAPAVLPELTVLEEAVPVSEADTLPERPSRAYAAASDGTPEQDLAFLEELDRAIAASSELTDPQSLDSDLELRPKKGIKCPECGYTNDAEAWYCGVCGIDLG